MTILFIVTFLVLIPATAAVLSESPSWSRPWTSSAIVVGAPVVYRRQEISANPDPDAIDVHPSARGEFYYYSLIKYLRVVEVLRDGRVIAVERNSNSVSVLPNDSSLCKARLTERLIYRWRFPRP